MTPPIRNFSPQRFVQLALSHWRSQLRHYLSWLLVCTIVAVPVLGMQLIDMVGGNMVHFNTDLQAALYFTGLLLFGPIFAAQHFGPMRRREHALQVLMQPASVTEKWALAALTILIMFSLVYTLWFSVLVSPVAALSMWWDTQVYQHLLSIEPTAKHKAPDSGDYALFMPFRAAKDLRFELLMLLCYVGLTGLATTGSLVFRRAPFLSTLVWGFIVMLGAMFSALFAPVDSNPTSVLFRWWTYTAANPAPPVVHALNAWLWVGIPCVLWIAAWRGLKERELT